MFGGILGENPEVREGDKEGTTPPKPSHLPQYVEDLLVKLDVEDKIKDKKEYFDIEGITAFQRVANYLSVAQIFLQSNALLGRPLTKDDVKPRLLGHFGTCPGLNIVYSHSNALISRHLDKGEDVKVCFVTGPGHGAPAILACLYLEGAITRFYPKYPPTEQGLQAFVRAFSWPGGFPSHVNAETPGAIHEGGELGYALAVSYGSVMDKPDLITVCVVGDGESESGPTAAAWHSHKFIDPAESGAVIPVLHCNGYKIANRTIPGCMDDLELSALYNGYGYQVRVVSYGPLANNHEEQIEKERSLNNDMAVTMEWCYDEIRKIQSAARSGKPIDKPRWPMIILRTPKGYTGPRKLRGTPIEGSYHSHQVPLPGAKTNDEEFKLLEQWLKSYHPEEIFVHRDAEPKAEKDEGDIGSSLEWLIENKALRIIPKREDRRMGNIKETYAGYTPLNVPEWKKLGGYKKDENVSAMKATGEYLVEVVKRNPHTFRIFSPDELASNKLDPVLRVTLRNFQWDPEKAHKGGRVIEVLSEHMLQGWLQGYTLTGRTGLFPSYESFLGIVETMTAQYVKFLKIATETKWRQPVSSLNYIMTSTLWRQEHNGYSHQNPGFIGIMLNFPSALTRIYFPPDANTAISCMAHVLRSKNYVNLIVGSKAPNPVFLSPDDAERHCVAGATIWKPFSTENGVNPDVVLVGIGVEVTFEIIAAAKLLQKKGVRVRVVNVVDLMILSPDGVHPHALSQTAFESLFTADKPVIINFHGYPHHVAGLFFNRFHPVTRKRFDIGGYIEEGTTTTPWMMLHYNNVSRYDVFDKAIGYVAPSNPKIAIDAHELQSWARHAKRIAEKYALEHGEDAPQVRTLEPQDNI